MTPDILNRLAQSQEMIRAAYENRAARIVEAKNSGMTWDQIAEAVGLSRTGVQKAVYRAGYSTKTTWQ